MSLISLGQIAGDGCVILLDKQKLAAIKGNNIVLNGQQNFKDSLWDIPVFKEMFRLQTITFQKFMHRCIYPSRSPQICSLTSLFHQQNETKLPLQHSDPFQHLDNFINNQIKEDKRHNPIQRFKVTGKTLILF